MALLRRSSAVGWRHIAVGCTSASSPTCCAAQRRALAADAEPASQDDLVLQTFKESQHQYRDFMAGLENIVIPLDGDDAAIKKYAQQVEALKQKVGMPSIEDVISAGLDHKMALAGYNARKFLTLAQDGVELGDYKGVVQELGKVVDEIESSTGAPLDPSNQEGWSQLQAKVEAIEKSNGLADYSKLKDTALFNMYKDQLSKYKQDAVDAMDNIKRRDNLEDITIDPKTLSHKAGLKK